MHTLLDEQFRLLAHVGAIVRVAGDGGGESRSRADLRLGVGWVMRGLDLQLAWIAASRGGPYPLLRQAAQRLGRERVVPF